MADIGMKLKNIPELFGFLRKSKKYPAVIQNIVISDTETIPFAQWSHPKNNDVVITRDEITELRRYVSNGDTVLDIGAHIGDTSVMFAQATGPEGVVFAVEPNSYAYEILQKNAELNRQTPIVVLPYAATSEDADLTFLYSDPGYCNGGDLENLPGYRHGHFYPLSVVGRNIQDILYREYPEKVKNVSLIKVDCEGSDLGVLENFGKLIETNRPIIISEVFKYLTKPDRQKLFKYFFELNYRIFLSNPWGNLKGRELLLEDVFIRNHFDIFCEPV